MKSKTKRLLAAVHDIHVPEYIPCEYFKSIPHSRDANSECGLPIWGMNPKTGCEYEVECVVQYRYYGGSGRESDHDYDPPSIDHLEVWHFREKIGMWHRMDVSQDTSDHICSELIEREADSYRDYVEEVNRYEPDDDYWG